MSKKISKDELDDYIARLEEILKELKSYQDPVAKPSSEPPPPPPPPPHH